MGGITASSSPVTSGGAAPSSTYSALTASAHDGSSGAKPGSAATIAARAAAPGTVPAGRARDTREAPLAASRADAKSSS